MKFGYFHSVTICGWMRTLKGITDLNSLIIYAIVFGFSQGVQEWHLDLEYISSALGIERLQIMKILQRFHNCGLINLGEKNGETFVFVFGRK